MKRFLLSFAFLLLPWVVARSAELPRFELRADQIANLTVDVIPGKPWLVSFTLTEKAFADYHAFIVAHLTEQISLVVAGTEIFQPRIGAPVDENPITFRMFARDKFIAILSALPDDPQ